MRQNNILLLLFLLLLLVSPACAWVQGYNYRQTINITSPATVANYQHYINLSYQTGMQSDFDDIRFTTEVNETNCPYFIEQKVDGSYAYIWIKIPTTYQTHLSLYYGNSTATSASDGTTTFDFFDDFNNGTTLDVSKWTAASSASVSSGEVQITSGNEIYSVSSFSRNICLGAKIKTTANGAWSEAFTWGSGTPIASHQLAYTYGAYGSDFYWIYDSGSATVTSSKITTIAFSNGVYYRTEIATNSGTGAHGFIWLATNARGSETTTETQGTLDAKQIRLGGHTTASTMYCDFVYARKYQSTEPSLTLLTPVESFTPTHFTYFQNYTITGTSTVTNYPLKFTIFNTSGTSTGYTFYTNYHTNATWADLRFTDSSNNLMDYWIESTNATAAVVWVEHPSLTSGSSSTFRLFYGNSSVGDFSDGNKTFDFFDHFGGSVLDTSSKWSVQGSPTIAVSSSVASITAVSAASAESFYSKFNFPVNYAMMSYLKTSHSGSTGVSGDYQFFGMGAITYYPSEVSSLVAYTSGTPPFYRTTGGGSIQDTTFAWTANTYTKWQAIRNGTTSVIFSVNDGTPVSHSTYINTSSLYCSYYVYKNTASAVETVDWIAIRKFTYPEPTTITNTGEQSTHLFTSSWLTGYGYRLCHDIQGNTSWTTSQTDYPVKITLFNTTGSSSGEYGYVGNGTTQTSWNDVRFVNTSNDGLLQYWLESTNATSATFWVKIPVIPNNSAYRFYVYYNNSTAVSLSNGESSFSFFDHFLGTTLNTNIWTISGTGSNSISNSIMQISASGSNYFITSNAVFGQNTAIRTYAKDTSFDNDAYGGFGYQGSTQYFSVQLPYMNWGAMRGYWASYKTAGTGAVDLALSDIANYYPYDLIRNGSTSLIINCNGVNKVTYTGAQIPDAALNIMFYAFTSGKVIYSDWTLVRKYISPEPSHSTWCGEPTGDSLSSYTFHQNYTIVGTADITNYPIKFTIFNTSGTSTGYTFYTNNNTNTSWADLRFTDSSNNPMDYWIESTNATAAVVWVEHPTLVKDYNSTFGLYYGNANASEYSNGTNTFNFFEHFDNGTTLNTSRWTGTASVTVTGSTAAITGAYLSWGNFYATSSPFIVNTSLYTRLKSSQVGGNPKILFGNDSDASDQLSYEFANISGAYLMVRNNNNIDHFGRPELIADTYYRTEISRSNSTGVIFKTNDAISRTFTNATCIPDEDLRPEVEVFSNSGAVTIDWIIVKKYIPIIPSVTSVTAQTPETPSANFTGSPTSGYESIITNFADSSTGNPTIWNWSFGDGNWYNTTTSANKNTSHTYSVVGNYSVSLYISNGSFTSTQTRNDYISVLAPPITCDFTGTPVYGTNPLEVTFTSATTNATSWYWDFGDNTNSTSQNPTHTYSEIGIYNVSLNASSNYTFIWQNKTNYITVSEYECYSPVSGFSANTTVGNAPAAILFTDSSTNATSWYWDFGDNATSTDQNPTHIYNTAGVYTVQLNASNACGYSWTNQSAYITISCAGGASPPVANFSASPRSGEKPLTVDFTNLAENATSYQWDFNNDGMIDSTDTNPSYVYSANGTYSVRLVASSTTCGSDTNIKGGYIVVGDGISEGGVYPTATIQIITGYNVSNRTYSLEDSFIPFWFWALLIIIGVAMLLLAIFSDTVIFSMISFICFMVATYATPTVAFMSHKSIMTDSINGTYSTFPIAIQATQPWVMWLLLGCAIIAMLHIFAGVIQWFKEIKEPKYDENLDYQPEFHDEYR